MEKQGVIREGVTPPEHEKEKSAAADINIKKQTAAELDADFRRRAAEAAKQSIS